MNTDMDINMNQDFTQHTVWAMISQMNEKCTGTSIYMCVQRTEKLQDNELYEGHL